MSMTRDITLKLVAVFCIAAVIVALVVAHQSPAAGYELSMYSSTPVLFWYLLILSLVGGIGIVIHELATGRFQENRTYLVGFTVILLTLVAFLCLPDIRNYVTWRADQMGHIGFVQDISLTGHIGNFNPYPIIHTLLSQIASITGAPIFRVVNLNTALVFPIFVLTTYLLATVVLPHKGQQLLAALIAGGTMAGLSRFNLIPNTWSILMLPLFFYCYFKRDRLPFKVLLVILLAAYPFFHPLSSLIIIAALVVMEIPKPIYSRLLRRLRLHVPHWVQSRPVLWPILLESAIFLPWVLTREAFRTNILQLWRQMSTFSGSQEAQKTGTDIGKAGLDSLGVVVIGLKLYGEILLFLILATVGIILLARQLRSGDQDHAKHRLLFVGALLLLASLSYAAFFIGIPGAEPLAAERLQVYIEVACIPLVAFALWELIGRVKFKHIGWCAVFGVVLLAAFLNIRAHNASPYMIRPGQQATQADMTGMTWYLEKKDPQVYAYWVSTDPARFAQCTLATTATRSREDIRYHDVQFRDHFGTDNYTAVGEQYAGTIYGNITKYDKLAYQTVWQALNRFNDEDFERLEQDPTVDRIYSNGATDILFITGHAQGRSL
jgi:hypothetical protein